MSTKMTSLKQKILIAAGCGAGLFLVAYGMIQGNNVVFLLGIGVIIVSYLAIRKKLRAALREKNSP